MIAVADAFSDRVLTLSPDAMAQEVNGETVILDIRSEQYFSLDVVGTRVWQLLQAQTPLESIVDTLLEEFEVDEATILPDANLQETLDLDSLDYVDLVVVMESNFGFTRATRDADRPR